MARCVHRVPMDDVRQIGEGAPHEMTIDSETVNEPRPAGDPVVSRSERAELLDHVQALLEPLMVVLGVAFLLLLAIDYGGWLNGTGWEGAVSTALDLIWVVFLLDFLLRFWIAPAKRQFLRSNWLGALSVALPFLRPLRAFRALRALRAARATRSLSLIRLLGGVNRGLRLLRRVAASNQALLIGGMIVLVVMSGAVGIWYFDQGEPGSPIRTFGDALWWSAALVTTMNSEKFAVSPEARVIGILIRIFGLSIFGYITATIASYLIGKNASDASDRDVLARQIRALRDEVAELRGQLDPHASRGQADQQ